MKPGDQLALSLAVAPAPASTWWRGLPDLSGAAQYVVLIRSEADPERSPRAKGSDKAPHITIGKVPAKTWAGRIATLLADGEPRTFNRIAVELVDKTADVVTDTTFEAGLWKLVERGTVEYTPTAPVLFRLVADAVAA